MIQRQLELLFVSQMPPSPPRFGGQVRMHGLMTALARRHSITAISLIGPDDDRSEVERAMRAYCREVVLVPRERGCSSAAKRLLQLRSLASSRSFERHLYRVPALQRAIDAVTSRRRFDVVNVEFPYLAHHRFRCAPPGAPPPAVVLDEHNVEYDVLRQVSRTAASFDRRVFNALNWRKVRREEEAAWRSVDGIAVCSKEDARAVRACVPGARLAVIANAVDVDHLRPRPSDPAPDGRTLLFFGALHYFPNTDGILFFLEKIWPLLCASHPHCRLKIVGPRPPREVLAHRGPRVEIPGFVEDLRPHLAEAAVVIAPLRLGGGTRLKILEGMSMAKPVVSTALGAEGLVVTPGVELLVADAPADFAAAVGRVLDDPSLATRLGRSARDFTERNHSWTASALDLERFFEQVAPPAAPASSVRAPLAL